MRNYAFILMLATGLSASAELMPPRVMTVPCEADQLAIDIASGERQAIASSRVKSLDGAWKWRGMDRYEATFNCPWKWYFRRTVLRVPVCTAKVTVKVNGVVSGEAQGDFLPAEFDISSELKFFGDNVIEVSGLEPKESVLVSEWKYAPKNLLVETQLNDDLKSGKFFVEDENGTVLKERDAAEPHLWSPEVPYLYVTPVPYKVGWWIFGWTEHYAVTFAFRRFEQLAGGVRLNGRSYRFRGIDRRDQKGRISIGTDLRSRVKDLRSLKGDNIDAVAASDAAESAEWYSLCDREGLMMFVTAANPRAQAFYANAPSLCFVDQAALVKIGDFAAPDADRKELRVKYRRTFATGLDWATGKVKLENRQLFAALTDYNLMVSGYKGEERVFRKTYACPEVPAEGAVDFEAMPAEEIAKCDSVRVDFHDGTHIVGGDDFRKGKTK